MNGFILSAGLGTRFRPVTLTTPKPLIPVNGKPAIEYSLEILQRLGVKEVVINTYHLSDKVSQALGDGSRWGLRIFYSREDELLGSAGGYTKGKSLFTEEDTTVILSADVITNANVSAIYDFHKQKKSEFTVGVVERADVQGSGILSFDQDHRVERFAEKPSAPEEIFSHWVNGSVYVVEPTIAKYLPPVGEFADFAHDLFPRLIKEGARFYAFPFTAPQNYLRGIDSPELLKQVETDILNSKVLNEK